MTILLHTVIPLEARLHGDETYVFNHILNVQPQCLKSESNHEVAVPIEMINGLPGYFELKFVKSQFLRLHTAPKVNLNNDTAKSVLHMSPTCSSSVILTLAKSQYSESQSMAR